ncbi:MAG: integrase core domain-containing protein [Candidatus Sedimenticola sp. (ex Thyasira tokunagai)]
MNQRIKLIGDWLSGDYSKTALSARFGVSRPTVDKWIARYEVEGPSGLEERSRIPRSCPHLTSKAVAAKLIEAKLQHMDWGPKKLVCYLSTKWPKTRWPAPSTAGEILRRQGLVSRKKRSAKTPPYSQPFRDCEVPNQVWSVDYKGQFKTGDGRWCYPLTVTDNNSRYLLLCQGLAHPRLLETRPWFEWVFREYGLPDAIRSDNGSPFASVGLGGLSALSVWWIKLGIIPERIKPGRPDQNGRHERMHRSLKAATLKPPAEDMYEQQKIFNAFQQEFNVDRPHEALDMNTPASRYYRSLRSYPGRLPGIDYEDEFEVRRVRSNGEIKWQGRLLYVSEALIGESVGLKETDTDQWALYFSTFHIGDLNVRNNRFERPKV